MSVGQRTGRAQRVRNYLATMTVPVTARQIVDAIEPETCITNMGASLSCLARGGYVEQIGYGQAGVTWRLANAAMQFKRGKAGAAAMKEACISAKAERAAAKRASRITVKEGRAARRAARETEKEELAAAKLAAREAAKADRVTAREARKAAAAEIVAAIKAARRPTTPAPKPLAKPAARPTKGAKPTAVNRFSREQATNFSAPLDTVIERWSPKLEAADAIAADVAAFVRNGGFVQHLVHGEGSQPLSTMPFQQDGPAAVAIPARQRNRCA